MKNPFIFQSAQFEAYSEFDPESNPYSELDEELDEFDDGLESSAYPGISCVTPGNPYVLHCFPPFKTELTGEQHKHLDIIAEKIQRSFSTPTPITTVEITGHSARWHETSQGELDLRAIQRAGNAAEQLTIRLYRMGLSKTVDVRPGVGLSDTVDWLGKSYSSTDGSQKAQNERALNRRVEIHLKQRLAQARHPVIGTGVIVPGTYLRSDDVLEDLLKQSIIGSCRKGDIRSGEMGRRRVGNSIRVPFRWICALEPIFVDPDNPRGLVTFGYAGTGVLVSPRHVLTSGHLLHAEIEGSKGTTKVSDAIAVRVIPGINGKSRLFGIVTVLFRDFFGSKTVKNAGTFRVSQTWRERKDVRMDYGLIKLPLVNGEPLGNRRFRVIRGQRMGWWGSPDFRNEAVIEPIGRGKLDGRPVTLVGYPLDKQLKDTRVVEFQQWISQGKGKLQAYSRWADDNFVLPGKTRREALTFKSGRLITYDACAIRGNSGSPVWVITSKRRNLVAVHGRGIRPAPLEPYDFGAGVLLTSSVLETLHSWRMTM